MLMNYNNPEEAWYHDLKRRPQGEGCLLSMLSVTFIALAIALMLAFSGCTTTRYVPVEHHTTENHWHTDSVKERDSVHTERNTVIRELDSAAMAKYGIQMERNQKAWLVLQREMEARMRELERMTDTKDTIRDSIPIPYPVEVTKEVPRERSTVEWVLIAVGILSLMILIINVANKIRRFLP
jgi:hypothetical protein